jgi:predicted small secreted protein
VPHADTSRTRGVRKPRRLEAESRTSLWTDHWPTVQTTRGRWCTTVATMRTWPVAALAALALALAACNGSSGRGADETAIRTTVTRWVEAVVHHESPAACALLSRGLREQIERHLRGEGVNGSCRTWAARWVSPRHPASHREARITAVDVHAESATVSLTAPGIPDGGARLVKENGGWRIDDF